MLHVDYVLRIDEEFFDFFCLYSSFVISSGNSSYPICPASHITKLLVLELLRICQLIASVVVEASIWIIYNSRDYNIGVISLLFPANRILNCFHLSWIKICFLIIKDELYYIEIVTVINFFYDNSFICFLVISHLEDILQWKKKIYIYLFWEFIDFFCSVYPSFHVFLITFCNPHHSFACKTPF